MQTLGVSDSTPATENRLQALLWPSISTANDVDYLGTQGYWICTVVGVATFIFAAIWGLALPGAIVFLFYYLGGVGVRERSRYAAIVVFATYAIDMLLSGIGVIRVIFSALLLANVRATWIAATWRPDSEEATLPLRLKETLGDKLADQFPMWFWPKIRFVYYVFSAAYVVALVTGWWTALVRWLVLGHI